jgi:hypothetical protein
MIATGKRDTTFELSSGWRPITDGLVLSDWQLQLSAGSEQQAPVCSFGVRSPQQGAAALLVAGAFDATARPKPVRAVGVGLQQLLALVGAGDCCPEVELMGSPISISDVTSPIEGVNEQSRKLDTYIEKKGR